MKRTPPPNSSAASGAARREGALRYATAEIAILPIYPLRNGKCACGDPKCGRNMAKHPILELVPRGVLNASADPKVIERWWTGPWSDANIGVRAGRENLNIGLADIDNRSIAEKLIAVARDGKLPDAYVVKSGGPHGGAHLWYFCKGKLPPNQKIRLKNGKAIGELRTHNQYVVAPPSVGLGGLYEAIGEAGNGADMAIPIVSDVLEALATHLAVVGAELLEAVPDADGEEPRPSRTKITPCEPDQWFMDKLHERYPDEYLSIKLLLEGKLPTGKEGRSGSLFHLAAALIRGGLKFGYLFPTPLLAGILKRVDHLYHHKYDGRPDADRYYTELVDGNGPTKGARQAVDEEGREQLRSSAGQEQSGQQGASRPGPKGGRSKGTGAKARGGWSRPSRHEAVTNAYQQLADGLVWLKPTQNGLIPTLLTNFTAKICSDTAEDDGSGELRHSFEIEAQLYGRTVAFTVPAERFGAMNWPVEHLGASAIIFPGLSAREHSRVAIQLLSGDIPRRRVYTHIGWRHLDARWVYLHAAGAIGPNGPVRDIEVRLDAPLDRFRLPDPPSGADLVAAVRASLKMLDVGPDLVTVPIYGSVWRAPLGAADYSHHFAGDTGAGKTEVAALGQQHYGSGMDSRHLPGTWSSTGNALEAAAFAAKDALFVVDDFAPTGAASDVQRLNREADRLIRAQGNQAGRLRMRADTSLRPAKYPRGIILSTGEDIPRGPSLRARLVISELERIGSNAISWKHLSVCQRDAAAGLYAQALAGYIRWLASGYETLHETLPERFVGFRNRATNSAQHRRTPEIVANIALGYDAFLDFAIEVGALNEEEAEALWERIWKALGAAAEAQAQHQGAGDPVRRFLELLAAAIAGGQAHIATRDGDAPEAGDQNPAAWGWTWVRPGGLVGAWRANGPCVGWLDDNTLYLEPNASFATSQRLATTQGDSIAVTVQTLHKRMNERGLLIRTDQKRQKLKVRVMIAGQRREVLAIDLKSLLSYEPAQPAPPTQTATASFQSRGLWAGSLGRFRRGDSRIGPGIGPR